jgi:hypothetical protein
MVLLNAASVRVLGLAEHREAAPTPPPVVVAKVAPPVASEETADRTMATAPELAERKLPEPQPKALLGIHGTIRVDVRVQVAEDGSVQSAELVAPAQSQYFNQLSLVAAQGSRFQASAAGAALLLRYEYSREGVQVSQPAE